MRKSKTFSSIPIYSKMLSFRYLKFHLFSCKVSHYFFIGKYCVKYFENLGFPDKLLLKKSLRIMGLLIEAQYPSAVVVYLGFNTSIHNSVYNGVLINLNEVIRISNMFLCFSVLISIS